MELGGRVMAKPLHKLLLDRTQPAQGFLPALSDGMTAAEL